MLGKCDEDGCTGHLGKYGSCLAEALHMLALRDGSGDVTGDVDAHGHFTLLILPECESVTLDDSRVYVVPVGNYVLREDSQGFVDYESFSDESSARECFEAKEARYSEWLDDDEGSE